MELTQQEIKNLEKLILSPQEENVKLAFSMLEGKEYPDEIKILLEEYKTLFNIIFYGTKFENLSLEEICLRINRSEEEVKINKNIQEIGVFKKISRMSVYSSYLLFTVLSQFTALEELFITGTDPDFRQLITLKHLKKLGLFECEIEQLPNILEEMTSLEELSLEGNDLSKADFTPVLSLKNLKTLVLYNCGLSKLPPMLETLQDKGMKIYWE